MMKRFFKWLFELPGDPEPTPVVVAQVIARPAEIQPTTQKHIEFAEWRVGHIVRWLEHNPDEPEERRKYLQDEHDMHVAMLSMMGR